MRFDYKTSLSTTVKSIAVLSKLERFRIDMVIPYYVVLASRGCVSKLTTGTNDVPSLPWKHPSPGLAVKQRSNVMPRASFSEGCVASISLLQSRSKLPCKSAPQSALIANTKSTRRKRTRNACRQTLAVKRSRERRANYSMGVPPGPTTRPSLNPFLRRALPKSTAVVRRRHRPRASEKVWRLDDELVFARPRT